MDDLLAVICTSSITSTRKASVNEGKAVASARLLRRGFGRICGQHSPRFSWVAVHSWHCRIDKVFGDLMWPMVIAADYQPFPVEPSWAGHEAYQPSQPK
jgi:hypothetical protein